MLVHSNMYMRREIHRITRTMSYSSNYMTAHHLAGLKVFRSPQQVSGTRYVNMYSQTVNTSIIKETKQELPSQSTYEAAMEALTSLITRKKRDGISKIDGKYKKLERMSMYIQILGLEEHIAGLNIIHVAGTKGKGSTCTFCEAILRECGFRTALFTSPHLVDVKERFRLNGLEISEGQFLPYFWDCWNQLKEKVTDDLPMPPLFQFLTLLALKIFVSEKVNVAIIEVGLGGKKDSTNVIKEPVVCGITSLGMDHTEILGDTLGEIASHKAGIFKCQVPAFTVPQPSEAMNVLKQRAHELEVPLQVVAPLTYEMLNGVELSLSGDHQLVNAGLAVSLCKSWLMATGNWQKLLQNDTADNSLPEAFLRGLSTALLSGRAQIVHDSSLGLSNPNVELIFYLDGAHSPESMDACARWFCKAAGGSIRRPVSSFPNIQDIEQVCIQHPKEKEESKRVSYRILLFNCMETRDPEIILPRLVNICASSGCEISKAIFVPSISTYNKVTSGASEIPLNNPSRDLSWQLNLQRIWEKIMHGKDVEVNKSAVFPSLPLAISWLRNCARDNPEFRFQVLVTGSLHLVGDVLKLLKR